MNKKNLPYIPVQPESMGAEFADLQYVINDAFNCRGKERTVRYKLIYNTLLKLVFSQYKWYGVDEREAKMIERNLILNGRVIAVKTNFDVISETPDSVFFGQPCSNQNDLNVDFYGHLESAGVVGVNGITYFANNKNDFVLGYSSLASYNQAVSVRPMFSFLRQMADEIDDAYAAWKVATESRKAGSVYTTTNESVKKLVVAALKKVSENEPYVVLNGKMNDDIKSLFPNYSSNILEEFYDNFMNVWSSNLDLLGMQNNHNNKKERLIVDELSQNLSLSRYIGADGLRARKLFCEECNEKFGMSMNVENYLDSVSIETQNEANVEGDYINE